MICPKCNKEHDGSGFPPSLAGKLKICVKCYRKKKKVSDFMWRNIHLEKGRIYARRKELALKEDMGHYVYKIYKAKGWYLRGLIFRLKYAKRPDTKERLEKLIEITKAEIKTMRKTKDFT